MTISTDDLRDFFARYGDALARFDADTSAALWAEPGQILNDHFAGALGTRAEMADGLRQSYGLYRQLDLAGVEFDLLDAQSITERISRARVRWYFLDGDGRRMADSDYEYLVRRDDGDLLVHVAVGINDTEKLAELAARKGVQLPGASDEAGGADDGGRAG